MNSKTYTILLVQSIARESGRLCPKMTSSDGSFSSPTGSSSRCWLAWLLSEARLSSRLLAISFSASSSMSSYGSISPIFVSFHSVCSCLSLSPPRTSRLLFASPWVLISVVTPTALLLESSLRIARSTTLRGCLPERERVLLIGTQFSILCTSMYSPAGAASPCAWCL